MNYHNKCIFVSLSFWRAAKTSSHRTLLFEIPTLISRSRQCNPSPLWDFFPMRWTELFFVRWQEKTKPFSLFPREQNIVVGVAPVIQSLKPLFKSNVNEAENSLSNVGAVTWKRYFFGIKKSAGLLFFARFFCCIWFLAVVMILRRRAEEHHTLAGNIARRFI